MTELTEENMDKVKRADCYKLFSACFCQPEKELFTEENVLDNLVKLLEEVCPEAVTFSREMKTSFNLTESEDLAVEYASLFVGPFELKAPPYASVYLENNRKVMGDTTMETMKLYQDAGLEHDANEPADHIAIELEFLYHLISSELEADFKNDKKEVSFMREHQKTFLTHYLGKWIYNFCSSIKSGSKKGYYHSLADCVTAFIRNELKTIH